MKKLLTVLITALLATVVVAGPASAQDDRTDRAEPTDVRPADKPTDVRPDDKPTDVRPDVEPEREHLRLHCNGRISDDGRAAVVCEWSEAQHPRAAGYILERVTEDTDPIVVLATRDLGVTRHVDADIRVGVKYGYRVRVVDTNGVNVGGSEWVRAGVEAPDPEIEALKLECKGRYVVTDEGRAKAVHCEWRAATHPDAAGYQLWRIVNDSDRELVWRGGLDALSHTSRVGLDTKVAIYALLAVDADGNVVGQSRPEVIRFHHARDRLMAGALPVR